MGKQHPLVSGLMAGIGAAALYRAEVKPRMYVWGAGDDEVSCPLPGDELVMAGVPRTTRAVTVDAPVEAVWPWLAQIGEDRGGFYSYSWLERAVGAQIHNADAIHPEWQRLEVGDTVWLARRYGQRARQVVAAIKPDSHLVLMSPQDYERVRRGERASGAWGFYLRREHGWTRLLARGSGGAVGHVLFDIPHFVMEQKMMRGIRDRAQETYRRRAKDFMANRDGGESVVNSKHRLRKKAAETALRD
ncbi:hypothetical protein [Mycolicibacterium stellerae]|uniref:hypothetical protein n=1 Tax=Mycolicibacterium stellerae TaxID=2358193 RepID=UPI001F354378|nr:hypothetical protein [Mycolicibacterium stellerae]